MLVIDIPYFYFKGGAMPLADPELAAANAAKVIGFFREKGLPVIHVRHLFEPGGDIHALVHPAAGEKIFEKTAVNSFLNTGLKEHLESLGVKNIVICGMQTHMCAEAAVRAASDMGFKVTLINDACATRNLTWTGVTVPAEHVHASTLAALRSYCSIESAQEYISKFTGM